MEATSSTFGIVGLAASAGGIAALNAVLGRLPGSFPIPIAVVQHLDPRHRSLLSLVLGRRTPLGVEEARDGERLRAGWIYVAPPDRHLLINRGGVISLTQTELVHFTRPSADLLFESIAAAYGDSAIGVVLSGSGVDGAMGVRAIKNRGGTVIAQDEESSEFSGMPSAAIATGMVDFVLPLEEIAPALVALVTGRPD